MDWTPSVFDRFGSKLRKVTASKYFPVYAQFRTFVGGAG
jgi:hypothetical protein